MSQHSTAKTVLRRLVVPSVAVLILGAALFSPPDRTHGARPVASRGQAAVVEECRSLPAGELGCARSFRLRYGWKPGTEWLYAFEWAQEMRLTPSPEFAEKAKDQSLPMDVGQAQVVRLEVRGGLAIRCYAHVGDGALVGYQFRDLTVCQTIEGQGPTREAPADVCQEREREVLALVSARGDLLEMRFAPDMDRQAQIDLRGVLGVPRLVLPEDSEDVWTTEESDPLGVSEARHTRGRGPTAGEWLVSKTRSYRTLQLGGRATPDATGTSIEGGTEAVFSETPGLVTRLRTEETVRLSRADVPYAILSTLRASMRLVAQGTGVIASDVQDGARDRLSSWSPARETTAADGRAMADRHRQVVERERAGTLSFERLVATLGALSLGDRWPEDSLGLFDDLRILFQHDPASIERALALLVSPGQLPDRVGCVIVDALGAAGTADAQEALGTLLERGDVRLPFRESAALAAAEVADLGERLQSRMIARVQAREGEADTVALALLQTLGIAAGHRAERDEVARADGMARVIERAMTDCADPRWRRCALLGLGNAGRPSSLSLLLDAARSSDADVRATAALALRRLVAPEARARVAELAERDPSQEVRIAAVRALVLLHDAASDAVAARLLREDADPTVRQAAVVYFERTVSRTPDATLALLRQAASTDPSPDVRAAIESALAAIEAE